MLKLNDISKLNNGDVTDKYVVCSGVKGLSVSNVYLLIAALQPVIICHGHRLNWLALRLAFTLPVSGCVCGERQ